MSMTGTEQQTGQAFSCAACGKQYRWKPELAGKRVKCKCGEPIAVPAGTGGNGKVAAPAAAGQQRVKTAVAAKPQTAAKAVPPPPAKKLGPEDEPGMDLDGLYALANDEQQAANRVGDDQSQGYPCPSCRSMLSPGTAICLACGTDIRTGRKLATATGAPSAGASAAILAYGGAPAPAATAGRGFTDDNLLWEGSKFRNLYLPLGLTLAGLIAYFVQAAFFSNLSGVPATFIAVALGVSIFIDIVLIFAALIVSVKLLDLAFGHIGPATLKIFAIALGPGALATIVEVLVAQVASPFAGIVIGSTLAIVLYYVLIKVLFDLELAETLQLAGVIYFMRRWVKGFLMIAVFMMIIKSGAGGSLLEDEDGAGVAALTGVAGDPEALRPKAIDPNDPEEIRRREAERLDGAAIMILQDPYNKPVEAREWISVDPKFRKFFNFADGKTQPIIDGLYEAGAKKVSLSAIYSTPYSPTAAVANVVVVELPMDNPAARSRIFKEGAKFHEIRYDYGSEQEDVGQKYLILRANREMGDTYDED